MARVSGTALHLAERVRDEAESGHRVGWGTHEKKALAIDGICLHSTDVRLADIT